MFVRIMMVGKVSGLGPLENFIRYSQRKSEKRESQVGRRRFISGPLSKQELKRTGKSIYLSYDMRLIDCGVAERGAKGKLST